MMEPFERAQFYVALVLIVIGLALAVVMVSLGAIAGP